jgi:fatty acid desaturase
VCTAAAVLSAWCVGRAVLVAESAEREARTRRRRGHDAIESLQVGIAVAGAWVAIGFAGQVALPFATQLFLRLFG